EEIDITTEEFYKKVKESSELPKTSQPSIGYITEKLEELSNDYDAVISIHLSSGISGTYQAMMSAGEMVRGLTYFRMIQSLAVVPKLSSSMKALKWRNKIKRLKTSLPDLMK